MINIFGNQVNGKIISELENVVIVEDENEYRHVVHKKTIDKNFVSKQTSQVPTHFDLEECMQTHKRPELRAVYWVDVR